MGKVVNARRIFWVGVVIIMVGFGVLAMGAAFSFVERVSIVGVFASLMITIAVFIILMGIAFAALGEELERVFQILKDCQRKED